MTHDAQDKPRGPLDPGGKAQIHSLNGGIVSLEAERKKRKRAATDRDVMELVEALDIAHDLHGEDYSLYQEARQVIVRMRQEAADRE